jgi:hypothetical protein
VVLYGKEDDRMGAIFGLLSLMFAVGLERCHHPFRTYCSYDPLAEMEIFALGVFMIVFAIASAFIAIGIVIGRWMH